jgi:hypothetical protein
VPGSAADPAHAGAIVLTGVSPVSMLPPVVGTGPLTEVTLVRPMDNSSSALVRAVAGAQHFDCVQVEMGPAHDYLYATYAFHGAQFSSYAPSGNQTTVELLTLTYTSVDWEYQLRDGTPVVTGNGVLGSTPDPRGPQQPVIASTGSPVLALLLSVGVGLVLVAVVWAVLGRRRRRRGTRP